jgi:hypothetical protein
MGTLRKIKQKSNVYSDIKKHTDRRRQAWTRENGDLLDANDAGETL